MSSSRARASQLGGWIMASWTPNTWKSRVDTQAVAYEDAAAVEATCARLRELPPLVTSWEIERLKRLLAGAQRGERFLVQGGDCAETLADCRSPIIADKLKILLQMSLVMIHEGKRPVVRVGRLAQRLQNSQLLSLRQGGKVLRRQPFEALRNQLLLSLILRNHHVDIHRHARAHSTRR